MFNKRKLAALLCCGILLMSSTPVNAQITDNSVSPEVLEQYNLQVVQDVPDNVTPIYVKDENELKALLDNIQADFDNQSITSSENNIQSSNSNILPTPNAIITPFAVFGPFTETNKKNVFNLSAIGGKIISEIKYTYTLIDSTQTYNISINYHDVYTSGIYGLQDITIESKTATATRKGIDANVRGTVKVYIGISGGGAEGNLVLATYRFDESYTITPSVQ